MIKFKRGLFYVMNPGEPYVVFNTLEEAEEYEASLSEEMPSFEWPEEWDE